MSRERRGRDGRPDVRRDTPRAAPSATPSPTMPSEPESSGVARALLASLALIALLRAVAAFVPGMWLWGLDVLRFVSPAGWALWLASVVALVPGVASAALRPLERAGAAMERRPTLALALAAILGATLAWVLSDRVWFLGDYILRLGALARGERFESFFPQSLPLDALLHAHLPRGLGLTAEPQLIAYNRALGALEAAALAALAAQFAGAVGARGATRLVVACAVFWSGSLVVFTGFGKSASELCLIAAAIGAFGVACVRTGRGLIVVHAALAFGLALHRSAILFVPAAAVVTVMWWRVHGAGAGGLRRLATAAALPAVALAWAGPRMVRIMTSFDARYHLASEGDPRSGGPLAAAFAWIHLVDVKNLVMALAPLALAIPALVALRTRRLVPAREGAPLLVLAASWLPAVLFTHPQQGVFRDGDVFAPVGVAIALVAAWLIADAFDARPRRAWLLVPLLAAAVAPSAAWLLHAHDVDRGLARVRAFEAGPPVRSVARREQILDYVGLRCLRLHRYAEAADAFERSVALVPHPRVIQEWALAATLAADYPTARDAYRTLLARRPDDPLAWFGLAGVAIRLGDSTETARAMARLEGYANDRAAVNAMADYARAFPPVWPFPFTGLQPPAK